MKRGSSEAVPGKHGVSIIVISVSALLVVGLIIVLAIWWSGTSTPGGMSAGSDDRVGGEIVDPDERDDSAELVEPAGGTDNRCGGYDEDLGNRDNPVQLGEPYFGFHSGFVVHEIRWGANDEVLAAAPELGDPTPGFDYAVVDVTVLACDTYGLTPGGASARFKHATDENFVPRWLGGEPSPQPFEKDRYLEAGETSRGGVVIEVPIDRSLIESIVIETDEESGDIHVAAEERATR